MKSNKNIKEALNHEVPTWDDTAMWDQIEESLPQEKKRRRIFWWLFGGASITAIGLISVLYLLPSQKTENHTQAEANAALNVETKIRKNKDAEIKTEAETTSINSQSKSRQESPITESREIITSASEYQSNTTKAPRKTTAKLTKNQTTYNNLTLTPKPNTLPIIESTEVTYSAAYNQTTTVSQIPNDTTRLDASPLIAALTFTPKSTNRLLTLRKTLVSSNKTSWKYKSRYALQVSQAITFDFGIYGTQRSISAPNHSDWLSIKDQQETVLETVDFNLQYQHTIYRNIQLGVGIGYSQVNEILTWQDTMVAAMDTTYTSSIKTVRTTSDVLQVETPNSYKTVYVPVSVGYVKTQNKWMHSATIGADVSLFTSYSGRYLTTDLQDIGVERSTANVTNNSIGLQSLTASMNVGYRLRQRLYLTAGFRGKYGLQNRLADSATDLRYHNYGVQIGLRYNMD